MHRASLTIGILAGFLAAAVAQAKPVHKRALADYLGPRLARHLNRCETCHLPEKPGAIDDEKPHNPFGARLAIVKDQLEKAGKKADIPTCLETIADEDADGDGVPNLLELLSGHNPGDSKDRPSAAEIDRAKQELAAFRKEQSASRWSPFEKVQRPAVPQVKDPAWNRNPIDAFLAAEHERRGLRPMPEAPRAVLLRRIYVDLIGLPPTRAELHAFLADSSPDAYERVVDRLLASPRYGERWGRHWMDVWRYSDWAGYGDEVRDSQRHIWHWRDWIIESLNQDKTYDRMILEMLAADELVPEDASALRATGFLARNWYRYSRNVSLENLVEHTGKAFLGVTMNCARCHDHFFDPISQHEYYAFRAIFEPYDVRTDRVPGVLDVQKNGVPRVFDANPTAPTYLFMRGNEANPDKSKSIAPGVPAALAGPAYRAQPVTLPRSAYCPDKHEQVVKDTLAAGEAAIAQAKVARTNAQRNFAKLALQPLAQHPLAAVARLAAVQKAERTLALAEVEVEVAEVRQLALKAALDAERQEDVGKSASSEWKRAAQEAQSQQRRLGILEARKKLWLAQQAVEAAPLANRPNLEKQATAAEMALTQAEAAARQPATTVYTRRTVTVYPQTSTGRRLALARWIADPQNPLTARVAMNHIWLRHFGKPLVSTVFDFGKNGQPPTHPALLDWLADEFVRQNWSMKKMHRLMVTSRAYRMDSRISEVGLRIADSKPVNPQSTIRSPQSIDSDNRYLWRMNARRMEAEAVRDSVLYVAGGLDLTLGGPDIDHRQALTTARRSLYYQHAAEKQSEFLGLFDSANVNECYARSESIVPQQALALANSGLALEQSRRLAGVLTKEASADAAFVRVAYEQVLGRTPSAVEQAECERFLVEQAVLLAGKAKLTTYVGVEAPRVPAATEPAQRAREGLIHVLLNHNEFVMVR
jgi:hypothetical protein